MWVRCDTVPIHACSVGSYYFHSHPEVAIVGPPGTSTRDDEGSSWSPITAEELAGLVNTAQMIQIMGAMTLQAGMTINDVFGFMAGHNSQELPYSHDRRRAGTEESDDFCEEAEDHAICQPRLSVEKGEERAEAQKNKGDEEGSACEGGGRGVTGQSVPEEGENGDEQCPNTRQRRLAERLAFLHEWEARRKARAERRQRLRRPLCSKNSPLRGDPEGELTEGERTERFFSQLVRHYGHCVFEEVPTELVASILPPARWFYMNFMDTMSFPALYVRLLPNTI